MKIEGIIVCLLFISLLTGCATLAPNTPFTTMEDTENWMIDRVDKREKDKERYKDDLSVCVEWARIAYEEKRKPIDNCAYNKEDKDKMMACFGDSSILHSGIAVGVLEGPLVGIMYHRDWKRVFYRQTFTECMRKKGYKVNVEGKYYNKATDKKEVDNEQSNNE